MIQKCIETRSKKADECLETLGSACNYLPALIQSSYKCLNEYEKGSSKISKVQVKKVSGFTLQCVDDGEHMMEYSTSNLERDTELSGFIYQQEQRSKFKSFLYNTGNWFTKTFTSGGEYPVEGGSDYVFDHAKATEACQKLAEVNNLVKTTLNECWESASSSMVEV